MTWNFEDISGVEDIWSILTALRGPDSIEIGENCLGDCSFKEVIADFKHIFRAKTKEDYGTEPRFKKETIKEETTLKIRGALIFLGICDREDILGLIHSYQFEDEVRDDLKQLQRLGPRFCLEKDCQTVHFCYHTRHAAKALEKVLMTKKARNGFTIPKGKEE